MSAFNDLTREHEQLERDHAETRRRLDAALIQLEECRHLMAILRDLRDDFEERIESADCVLSEAKSGGKG